jgi:pyruvate dehydrogenase E1 component alpha subunit
MAARERALAGAGPTLIVAETYRFCGHSRSDKKIYRTEAEEQDWRRRDPVAITREKLLRLFQVPAGDLEELEERIEKQVQEAMDVGD